MSKKDELASALQSTLVRLSPSDLKRAQEIVANPGKRIPEGDSPEGSSALGQPGSQPAVPTENFDSPPPLGTKPVGKQNSTQVRPRVKKNRAIQLRRTEISLRLDQLELLHSLELQLSVHPEVRGRFSKAVIIRALIDLLPHLDLEKVEFTNEESLRQRILEKLGLAAAKS